jgi:ADP-ribosylglycohydrolase
MPSLRERIAGGLLGLLIGDAAGVPYEFNAPAQLPVFDELELIPPPGFEPTHPVPPGTWSDDGALALCLLESLLNRGRLDPADLAKGFLAWAYEGRWAVDGRVFDIGSQTSEALHRLQQGVPPLEAGPSSERRNGNGSLMRVLPLALWHCGPDQELADDAARQSRVTHGHPISQACCALYCLWARRVLAGETIADAYGAAVSKLRAIYPAHTPIREALEQHIQPDLPAHGTGSGYVVDCLHSARLALRESTYERVVKAAIALGHDTDTTACVAGGIAGIAHGLEGIPGRWRAALRGREIVDPLLDRLLAYRVPPEPALA